MASFEWMEQQQLTLAQELRIQLKESLNELRAKRRGLDLHIERLMLEMRNAEIQRDDICDKEDELDKEIQRRKP